MLYKNKNAFNNYIIRSMIDNKENITRKNFTEWGEIYQSENKSGQDSDTLYLGMTFISLSPGTRISWSCISPASMTP